MRTIPLYDDLEYPGHGMPPRADAGNDFSPWARLAKGQGFGKKVNILYDASEELDQPAPVPILELRGSDLDACQIQITLTSPKAIPRAIADLGINLQNQTGEFDNRSIGADVYPGTAGPIIWPPFVARIKWGVGGAFAEALVDFVNGTVINVPASAIDVSIAIPPDAINQPGTSGAYTLSAFAGPGLPRSGNAQRTMFVGSLATGAESDIFAVPAFAKRVTVLSCDPTAGTPAVNVSYLRFWQAPDGTSCVGNYIITGNVPDSFAVPNAAQYFSIVSGVSPTQRFNAVFDLSI